MLKKHNAQFAIEFIVLIAFMFLIFLGFTVVITSKILEAKENERQKIAEDIAALVTSEIDLAKSVNNGYSRTFNLPGRIEGSGYSIQIIDNRELVVNYLDKEYVTFLPENVIGDISNGLNDISKIDGIVYVKNIEPPSECSDDLDNDVDGAIDLADAGCMDVSDDDETNCGDGVCEGGENFLSCSSDCGGLGLLLMKSLTGNVISFTENGDAILKGTLTQAITPIAEDTQDEFIFKDSSGANVAIINLVTGNMVIQGTLNDNQGALTNPPSNDFIVKDSIGDIVGLIDESGNFYLKGTLTQNGNP